MKILCIGGGNAMPNSVLAGLKGVEGIELATIVPMTDSGGSTGQLRKDFRVLAPGDMRRHVLSLSKAPEWKKSLFRFRFGHEEFAGGHKGHSFGNVFIAGLENSLNDYEKALEIIHDFMEVDGKCLPASDKYADVVAELEDGTVVEGETEIDVPLNHNPELRIEKLLLKPSVEAYNGSIKAILESDMIIIGPGDLYSSLIPALLPKGISDAMKKTKAVKVFVCPAMTKRGETKGFTPEKFASEIEKYIGCELDFVICNADMPEKIRVKTYREKDYREEEPYLVEMVGLPKECGRKFACAGLLAESGDIVYDPKKLAKVILSLK